MSFLGHMHKYGSDSLKQNTYLAYYRPNQSVEIAVQSYTKSTKARFQTSVTTHASKPARK